MKKKAFVVLEMDDVFKALKAGNYHEIKEWSGNLENLEKDACNVASTIKSNTCILEIICNPSAGFSLGDEIVQRLNLTDFASINLAISTSEELESTEIFLQIIYIGEK
ncbi:MAG: hypothetical protein WDA26_01435 [Pusillimonas sp.]